MSRWYNVLGYTILYAYVALGLGYMASKIIHKIRTAV